MTPPAAEPQRSMIVTGGASGLGRAIADAAVRTGYRVGIYDTADPEDSIERPARSLHRLSGSVHDEAAVEAAFDEFGTPDVVVNNAGVVRFGPLIDASVADFRSVLDVNLVGGFIVARAAARRWIGEGRTGSIVNITSMNGVAAGPNAGAYGAAKAGLALLTEQMAIEWGRHGIRVNAVAPGLIDAGMSKPIYADPTTRAARSSKVPLGRLGAADDVADVVLFLAGDGARYVHGQNVVVDGGVTASIIAHLPRPASVDGVGDGASES